MSGYTPGPWEARQEYANRWRIEVPRPVFVPISVAIVTTTLLEVGCNDEDTAANARLIASAPELLEALLALKKAGGIWPDLQGKVDAAIAKATGSV